MKPLGQIFIHALCGYMLYIEFNCKIVVVNVFFYVLLLFFEMLYKKIDVKNIRINRRLNPWQLKAFLIRRRRALNDLRGEL